MGNSDNFTPPPLFKINTPNAPHFPTLHIARTEELLKVTLAIFFLLQFQKKTKIRTTTTKQSRRNSDHIFCSFFSQTGVEYNNLGIVWGKFK